jgi:hypothetical protein
MHGKTAACSAMSLKPTLYMVSHVNHHDNRHFQAQLELVLVCNVLHIPVTSEGLPTLGEIKNQENRFNVRFNLFKRIKTR